MPCRRGISTPGIPVRHNRRRSHRFLELRSVPANFGLLDKIRIPGLNDGHCFQVKTKPRAMTRGLVYLREAADKVLAEMKEAANRGGLSAYARTWGVDS